MTLREFLEARPCYFELRGLPSRILGTLASQTFPRSGPPRIAFCGTTCCEADLKKSPEVKVCRAPSPKNKIGSNLNVYVLSKYWFRRIYFASKILAAIQVGQHNLIRERFTYCSMVNEFTQAILSKYNSN